MEGFYRKEGGKGSYSQKEKKKKSCFRSGEWGERKAKVIFSSSGGWRGLPWQFTLLKIPDKLIKTAFLVGVEAAIILEIKCRFGIMGFSTSDAI